MRTRSNSLRILIDHGQYDHLNIGDTAMLQACVAGLYGEWPGAEIMVLTNSPGRLSEYCPGVTPVSLAYARVPAIGRLPWPVRSASERLARAAAPYLSDARPARMSQAGQPRTLVQAVRSAGLVVASGGGYITDKWSRHATGVLRVLRLAQHLGKPTAMLGQGLGPITQPALRARASAVLPHLAILGLREGQLGGRLALELGARHAAVTITGDDALAVIPDKGLADGQALGINLRVADYAGVDSSDARAISAILLRSAQELAAPIEALPISGQPADSDVATIGALMAGARGRGGVTPGELPTTDSLAASAASCRAIVTGSYHAAVFGLAQGVPAVCLTKSAYYDAKFAGLKALFPTACSVLSVAEPDFGNRLTAAVANAWHLPRPAREAAMHSAISQRESGRKAYTRLREAVEMADGLVGLECGRSRGLAVTGSGAIMTRCRA
jgi:polysaccharide pyruvyl transferase WcaK-like protein